MAKKDDTQIDAWRLQYPSTTVSWSLNGDAAYCNEFLGEAKNMLYHLFNRMNLANPKLKQFQNIRQYNDGTTIIVKSVFGQAFVEINAGRGGIPSCSVTLFGIPEAVQPMKWYPSDTYIDGIHGGEVEGVDYIKTYYAFSVDNCPNCNPLDLTICDDKDLLKTYGWSAPQTCKPFVYEDRYIPKGMIVPSKVGDPTNHCIYGSCQAEIIKFLRDDGGNYFLWKAYTEWSSLGPDLATFTQDGLGYLLLRAFIKLGGMELCASASSIVKVDCCLKPSAKRPVIMFWEKCVLGGWCPVPDVNFSSDILFFQVWSWISMGLWTRSPSSEVFGCLPFDWTLTGRGKLEVGKENTAAATYIIPTGEFIARDCHEQLTINVHDRCGTSENVLFKSCCDSEPGSPSIGYTLLIMPCSGSQTLTAWGGCPPYGWSFSGGGTLVPSEDTNSALYTAPATNANCTSNPTITLTDCCGSSGELKLAVNCYVPSDIALKNCSSVLCSTCQYSVPFSLWQGTSCVWNYGCNSTLLGSNFYDGTGTLSSCSCREGVSTLRACRRDLDPACCVTCSCCYACTGDQSCGLHDIRTADMKNAGCCPLNPITGLPYPP